MRCARLGETAERGKGERNDGREREREGVTQQQQDGRKGACYGSFCVAKLYQCVLVVVAVAVAAVAACV